MPMDSDGSDMLVRMYDDSNVYCATEIYDRVIANADKRDITALVAKLVLSRDTSAYAIDLRLPQLKAVTQFVKGHKGSKTLFQFIAIEPDDGASYLVAVRDLGKEDPLTNLGQLSADDLRIISAIVRRLAA
jgi:hypothetical protein